jgi:magnesium transporter
MSTRAWLFDADGDDRAADATADVLAGLTDRQLLWVDLQSPDEGELRGAADLFGLQRQSLQNLMQPIGRPRLDVLDDYFELSVHALAAETCEPLEVDLFAGRNWVVTSHAQPIEYLDEVRDRLSGGESEIGRMDSPSFLAGLLDWQLGTYFACTDELEKHVDRLDEYALGNADDGGEPLKAMVEVRRRVATVRRTLTPHREVFSSLARPDFQVLADSDSAAHFRALHDRMERAIDAVENARDLLIGSFDLYHTRTAQRTNDIMRALTVVSVVLLPAVVIAGVMGMNFRVGFFDEASMFWVVVGAMLALAVVTLVVARRRRWI